jgi:hypothetical protein
MLEASSKMLVEIWKVFEILGNACELYEATLNMQSINFQTLMIN